MQLAKYVQITIFKLGNDVFEPVGDLSQFTSLIWPDAFRGYSKFEIIAPITEENLKVVKHGHIVWCGGENAGIIEVIKSTVGTGGEKKFHIKGRTLECLLCNRIIWGTYTNTAKADAIIYDLVNRSCVSPSDVNRKIPYLSLGQNLGIGNYVQAYQKTGGELYGAIDSLAADNDLGFSIAFNPRQKQLLFKVNYGVDRTMDNTAGYKPVVFSTDLDDIISSEYYSNTSGYKSVAFVQGEDKGADRKSVTVGKSQSRGFDRYELYVDARDLQSTVTNQSGNSTDIPIERYLQMLSQRGSEKLSECSNVETFDAKLRQFGDIQYVIGRDYFKGDKVTVIDNELIVKVSARITEIEESFKDEYSLKLTFGYSYPTLLKKIKRIVG